MLLHPEEFPTDEKNIPTFMIRGSAFVYVSTMKYKISLKKTNTMKYESFEMFWNNI